MGNLGSDFDGEDYGCEDIAIVTSYHVQNVIL